MQQRVQVNVDVHKILPCGEILLYWDGKNRDADTCIYFGFFKPPRQDYAVEYRISQRGRFRVWADARDVGIQHADCRTMHKLMVCFLPEEWNGQRVSRRVIKRRATA